MDCKDILIKLRENKGLSQQELADKLFVTRIPSVMMMCSLSI